MRRDLRLGKLLRSHAGLRYRLRLWIRLYGRAHLSLTLHSCLSLQCHIQPLLPCDSRCLPLALSRDLAMTLGLSLSLRLSLSFGLHRPLLRRRLPHRLHRLFIRAQVHFESFDEVLYRIGRFSRRFSRRLGLRYFDGFR